MTPVYPPQPTEPEDAKPPAVPAQPVPDAGSETTAGGRPDVRAVPWRTFLGYFLGLGTWGFGGPVASVGYMQRDLVERRKWLSRQDFLDGVALGQTMPGPLAAQVVMWLGFLRAGTLGALATAAAFIRHRDNPQVQAFVKGATAAAAGAIGGAVVLLSRQTITDWPAAALAVVALALLLKWKIKEPILVVAGAAAGLALHWPW
jgi:chromate transporter